MKKKKSDTSVVMLYLLGKERLLPASFRRVIPFSTISSWRKVDYSTYIGHQYRFLFEENWDLIVLRERFQNQKKQLYSIAKSWQLLKKEVHQWAAEARKDRLLQKKLVKAVDLLNKNFDAKTATKLLGLKMSQYREWKMRGRLCCTDSEKSLCLRRFPNQLSASEVRKIKALLSSSKFGHWPVISITAYAQRKGFLMVSPYSWYKYARILIFNTRLTKRKKEWLD